MVWGDSKKIRTVVANLTANAVKYTDAGKIVVKCSSFNEPLGLRHESQTAVEIVVEDTGRGIPSDKLSNIFKTFENVEEDRETTLPGLGLGLAVVARIVEQLGGQLRVDSEIGKGSRFSFLMPFVLYEHGQTYEQSRAGLMAGAMSSLDSASTSSVDAPSTRSSGSFHSRSGHSEVDSLVQALSTPASGAPEPPRRKGKERAEGERPDGAAGAAGGAGGKFPVAGSYFPIRSVKMDETLVEPRAPGQGPATMASDRPERRTGFTSVRLGGRRRRRVAAAPKTLRVLVVDVGSPSEPPS